MTSTAITSATSSSAGSAASSSSPASTFLTRLDTTLRHWYHTSFAPHPLVEHVHRATGCTPEDQLTVVVATLVGVLVYAVGILAVLRCLALLYPAYMTFWVVEKNLASLLVRRQWMMYWIVYGVLHAIEMLVDLLFVTTPTIYYTKVLLLIVCFAPNIKGFVWVYEHIVRSIVQLYSDDVDQFISNALNVLCAVTLEIKAFVFAKWIQFITGKRPATRRSATARVPPSRHLHQS